MKSYIDVIFEENELCNRDKYFRVVRADENAKIVDLGRLTISFHNVGQIDVMIGELEKLKAKIEENK